MESPTSSGGADAADARVPRVSAEVKRRIAGRAIWLASVVAAIGVTAGVFLLALGQAELGFGVLAGNGLAMLVGLSWILGAVRTFDASFKSFARGTIGLSPVRFVVVIGALMAIAWWGRGRVDLAALGLTFLGTQLLLQIAQADCFMRLADAASPHRERRRARWGGLRFGGAKLWD